ncbi:TMEM175 family protein [Pediococcus acidilactici]
MKKLKERMDAFSDAVIAIIITIMVLELPLPQHDALSEYLQFGKSIGIFFISFCFVANIWYQHAMLFKDSDTMNDRVFVKEFTFLAFLSLTPIFTKVIIYDTNRTTIMVYGVLTMIVSILFMWLSYEVIKQKYTSHHEMRRIFHKIYDNHNNFLGFASVLILVLAYFYPKWAVIIYLAIPVFSFVVTRHDYTDFQDVTELPEAEQDQFLSANNVDLHELRKKQREIMKKYRGRGRKRNDPEMQAELRKLFQSYPDLANRGNHRRG